MNFILRVVYCEFMTLNVRIDFYLVMCLMNNKWLLDIHNFSLTKLMLSVVSNKIYNNCKQTTIVQLVSTIIRLLSK